MANWPILFAFYFRKVIVEHSHISLHLVDGCFCAMRAKLSSSGHMGTKPKMFSLGTFAENLSWPWLRNILILR